MSDQLDMFPGVRGRVRATVAAAETNEALVELARRLPPGLRMGTRGWVHPGWVGSIYAHGYEVDRLREAGLPAYATHPLLSTVTLERTRHRVPRRDQLRALAAQTPADFRFVAYLPYGCACPAFGRDKPNADFLSPVLGARLVAQLREGLGERLGVVVIEIPRGDPASYGGRRTAPQRLRRLLGALPAGPHYVVEPHDHKWIGKAYGEALADTGASSCLAIHPSAPPLSVVESLGPADTLVVHWSQPPRFDYDSNARYLQPFDARCQPDARTLQQLATRICASLAAGQPTWVLVDNLAEGCAPRSIEALASVIASGERPAGGPPVP